VDLYSAIQYVLFVALVTILVKPLGGYMERVFSRKRTVLDRFCLPVERLINRITAVDPEAEMPGKEYATCFGFAGTLLPFSECSSFFPGSSPSTTPRLYPQTWL
jgi:potassium-transporting ATPase potassium-binding subunit